MPEDSSQLGPEVQISLTFTDLMWHVMVEST